MEDQAIIDLWKSYGQKLDESLQLNRKNAADISKMKVQSAVAGMQPLKLFTIIIGIVWVAFVDMMIVKGFSVASPFFLVSAGIQVLLTKIALGIYLYQVVLIRQVDISEPILAAQQQLSRLRSSTIWVTRILLLQLPVWTTFYWNKSMLDKGTTSQFVLQAIITLTFTFAAIWLFANIRYENRDKRWFRLIFNGKEWQPVIQAMELLREIESYKEMPEADPK